MEEYHTKIDLLEATIRNELEFVSKALKKERANKRNLSIVSLTVTSLIPIVLGVNTISFNKEIAIILGGVATFIKGLELYMNSGHNIRNFTEFFSKINDIDREIQFYKVDQLKQANIGGKENPVDLMIAKYQAARELFVKNAIEISEIKEQKTSAQ